MIKIDDNALRLALNYFFSREGTTVVRAIEVYLAHDPAIAAMTRVIIDLDGNVPCAICRYGRPHTADCPVAIAKAHWTEE
jgi:hypothetical protein